MNDKKCNDCNNIEIFKSLRCRECYKMMHNKYAKISRDRKNGILVEKGLTRVLVVIVKTYIKRESVKYAITKKCASITRLIATKIKILYIFALVINAEILEKLFTKAENVLHAIAKENVNITKLQEHNIKI